MANSIRIDSGLKRILINNDPDKFIEFDPDDIIFVEKFYELLTEFKSAEKKFTDRAKELDAVSETDELGVPINALERIELMKELCSWCKEQIDYIFGEGTSQNIFGDSINLNMFIQFFEGITPFIGKAREQKIQKYKKVVADRKKIEDEKVVME